MDTMKYIPSTRTICCLAYLFNKYPAAARGDAASHVIALWAAQSLLIGHHGDRAQFYRDIAAIRNSVAIPVDELRKGLRGQSVKSEINGQLRRLADMESPISRSDSLFHFLYALIRWKGAVSFLSGKAMELTRVTDGEDDEGVEAVAPLGVKPSIQEHHIYPSALLRDQLVESEDDWFEKRWINDIANLTFILTEDNFDLGDTPAEEYLKEAKWQTHFEKHLIGPGPHRNSKYRAFLTERRQLIGKALKAYLEELERNAQSA